MRVSADAGVVTTEELTEVKIVRTVTNDKCVDDSPQPNVGKPDIPTPA